MADDTLLYEAIVVIADNIPARCLSTIICSMYVSL